MDILNIKDKKHIKDLQNETEVLTAVIQLQREKLIEYSEKVKHLEKLLKYEATILNINKEL